MVARQVYIINSHPVQYFVPMYQFLTKDFNIKVLYLSNHGVEPSYDSEFSTTFQWDIPLLEGYSYEFLRNYSPIPNFPFLGSIHWRIIKILYKAPKKSIIWVHGWQYFTNVLAIIFGKLFGHTICIRSETPLKHELNRKKSLLRKCALKLLFSFVDYCLSIGSQNKLFYQYYGVHPKKLLSMPYCVNNSFFLEYFLNNKKNKSLIKSNLGLPQDKYILIYVGKLIHKKRPLDLLKAFEKLKNSNLCLLFVGEGQLRPEIEEYIKENKIKDVFISGFKNQSEIVDYYLIADFYAMCSQVGETWGLATNEAMCFNLPLIISNMVGCSDDLVTEETGMVYECGDIQHLTHSIQKTIDLYSDRKKICTSQELIKDYSFDKISETLKLIVNE